MFERGLRNNPASNPLPFDTVEVGAIIIFIFRNQNIFSCRHLEAYFPETVQCVIFMTRRAINGGGDSIVLIRVEYVVSSSLFQWLCLCTTETFHIFKCER